MQTYCMVDNNNKRQFSVRHIRSYGGGNSCPQTDVFRRAYAIRIRDPHHWHILNIFLWTHAVLVGTLGQWSLNWRLFCFRNFRSTFWFTQKEQKLLLLNTFPFLKIYQNAFATGFPPRTPTGSSRSVLLGPPVLAGFWRRGEGGYEKGGEERKASLRKGRRGSWPQKGWAESTFWNAVVPSHLWLATCLVLIEA